MEQFTKIMILKWHHRKVLPSVLRGFGAFRTENHIGMVNKIAVDRISVRIGSEMNPIGFDYLRTFSFL